MEEFSKNIDGIRKIMKDLKAEKYAIENPELIELDEYVKNLYLKVLCTVVQYENDLTDMQILILKRIICGIGVEDSVEEYMRKALEISASDIQEFLSVVGEGKTKYYFAVDGLLVFSVGKGKQKGYEYLAELIELLGIQKDDLEYLCMVVKSILQQETSYYDEAKKMVNERVDKLDFTPYLRNYYAGAIIDADTEKHYYAPEKKLSKGMQYPDSYSGRKIVFENLSITLEKDWQFTGCEEVIFRNCQLNSIGGGSMKMSAIGQLIFDKCKVSDFANRVATIVDINNFEVKDCEFTECGYENGGHVSGGVFYIDQTGNNYTIETIKLNGNNLVNCYVKNESSWGGVSGVFLGINYYSWIKSLNIQNNTFAGCECIGYLESDYQRAMVIVENDYHGKSVEIIEKIENNNCCVGGSKQVLWKKD